MRFGVEIELDATDGRDFSSCPLAPGEMPKGADSVARAVSSLGLEIQTHGWKYNHNNSVWVCKPDSSCGMELCSPVLDESQIDEVLVVVDALAAADEITSGPKCAVHVHVDVSSMITGIPESSEDLCSVLAWWVKSEPVMLDSVPARRRNSRFCRCIGLTDLFDHDEKVVPCLAVGKLSEKYLTLNTHHLVARKRKSIEFRILEGTKDSELVGEWIRFVLNFVGRARLAGMPNDYRWISESEVGRLIESDRCSGWLHERILENATEDSSRFWLARHEHEMGLPARPVIFGRTAPSFIGAQRDK